MDSNIIMKGQFRLWFTDSKLRREIDLDCPDWSIEQKMAAVATEDTGWVSNVITDLGRRLLMDNASWNASALDVFISEASPAGNVRRTSMNFLYGTTQVVNPGTVDLDRPTLLQTRTATFSAVGVDRDINTVGLTTFTLPAGGFVHGIAAYSKLPSTRVQGAAQTADVQYRVTWSLD